MLCREEISLEEKPDRLHVIISSGDLLIYVNASVPSKTFIQYHFQKGIQCIRWG